MSLPNLNSRKLLPLIEFDESDVINMYALSGWGEKGTFVKVSAGNFDSAQGIIDNAGVAIDKTVSPMWGSLLKVVPCASGDAPSAILGVMLKNVFQYDENGQLLKFLKQKRIELDTVNSGEAVPILTEATILTLGTGAFLTNGVAPATAGLPAIGDVLVPANNGLMNAVPVASAAVNCGVVIGTTSQFGSGIVVRFR